MIYISLMTRRDVEGVANVDKRCFAVPWSEKSFYDETENALAIYFIAKDDEKYIGYGGFWNISGEGDITNIAVIPEYRRRGVATGILKTIIKKSRELSIETLTLEVRRSNKAAQSLYEKFGFKVLGFRKQYYSDNREDALIMTLNLSGGNDTGTGENEQ